MCVRKVICREGGTPSSAAGRRRLPARRPPSPTPRHNGKSVSGRLRSWSGPVETDFQGRLRFSYDNMPGLGSYHGGGERGTTGTSLKRCLEGRRWSNDDG